MTHNISRFHVREEGIIYIHRHGSGEALSAVSFLTLIAMVTFISRSGVGIHASGAGGARRSDQDLAHALAQRHQAKFPRLPGRLPQLARSVLQRKSGARYDRRHTRRGGPLPSAVPGEYAPPPPASGPALPLPARRGARSADPRGLSVLSSSSPLTHFPPHRPATRTCCWSS
jgi:hypothetical protein